MASTTRGAGSIPVQIAESYANALYTNTPMRKILENIRKIMQIRDKYSIYNKEYWQVNRALRRALTIKDQARIYRAPVSLYQSKWKKRRKH